MRHLMVCISGWAGTGKDECSGRLVRKHQAIHTGLADPGKRHMADTYGFTNEQLWGPSEFRNAGDIRHPKPECERLHLSPWNGPFPKNMVGEVDREARYWYTSANWTVLEDSPIVALTSIKKHGQTPTPHSPIMQAGVEYPGHAYYFVKEGDPNFWLSPREALQKYMELMNTLQADTWIRKGIDDHRRITAGLSYDKTEGLIDTPEVGSPRGERLITCFSDFRHIHEHRLARSSADFTLTPVLVRIKRPTVKKPPFQHRSETEQTRIRDAAYDFVIDNDKSLEDLYTRVDSIVAQCSNPAWRGKQWDPKFVLPNISEGYQP